MPLDRLSSDRRAGPDRAATPRIFGDVSDQAGDVVEPGAFRASLRPARMPRGGRVKFLWQHDPCDPDRRVAPRLDEDGQRADRRRRDPRATVTRGADALALMRAGAIDGLSIGYRTIRATENRITGGRTLTEVDLWEVSLVTFPMLPSARASLTSPVSPSEVNETSALVDALLPGSVLSRSVDVPATSADGDAYIVPAGATGAWSGEDGKVALYLERRLGLRACMAGVAPLGRGRGGLLRSAFRLGGQSSGVLPSGCGGVHGSDGARPQRCRRVFADRRCHSGQGGCDWRQRSSDRGYWRGDRLVARRGW